MWCVRQEHSFSFVLCRNMIMHYSANSFMKRQLTCMRIFHFFPSESISRFTVCLGTSKWQYALRCIDANLDKCQELRSAVKCIVGLQLCMQITLYSWCMWSISDQSLIPDCLYVPASQFIQALLLFSHKVVPKVLHTRNIRLAIHALLAISANPQTIIKTTFETTNFCSHATRS